MSCDLRQVTTIEVMEALNSLLRRQKGPDRKNIAFGEIAQTVADKHGVGPMVRSWSLLNRATALNHNIHSVTAYHAPNLCLLCLVLPDLLNLTLWSSFNSAVVQWLCLHLRLFG